MGSWQRPLYQQQLRRLFGDPMQRKRLLKRNEPRCTLLILCRFQISLLCVLCGCSVCCHSVLQQSSFVNSPHRLQRRLGATFQAREQGRLNQYKSVCSRIMEDSHCVHSGLRFIHIDPRHLGMIHFLILHFSES